MTSSPEEGERASQRHVVPTCAAHILSFSKTSSSSRVSCRYRVRYWACAFRSPMECPVSRRAHPASAGSSSCGRALSSRFVPHPKCRTSDVPSSHRPPRPLQALPPARPSSLPPRLRVRRAVCPEQGHLPPTGALSDRERPRTQVSRFDPNDELRALFTRGLSTPC
jgi:hypothetical protein